MTSSTEVSRVLRVLVLVDHARGISGPHRNVVGSLNALSARDDVQLRLLCREADSLEPFVTSGRTEIQYGYDPGDYTATVSNIRRVLHACRGCDVIYVPSGLRSLLYAQVARFGRPLVAGPNVSHLPIRKDDSPGMVELQLLSDAWFEASYARQAHVIRASGCKDVRVIHHAINTERWAPCFRNPAVWAQFGVPADALKVLYVGSDNLPLKGLDQLVRAFRLVRQRTSQQVHFVFVGRMRESTLRGIADLGSATSLGFIGPDMLPTLYASSDISVTPSTWEAFSFTVLESLACGLATIGSNAGGIPEQIVDGMSGRLIDVADAQSIHLPEAPERIAAAVTELLEDPALRAKLGKGARQRVLECFSESRLGSDLIGLFREVCER